jgi:hypothetical protein
MDQGQSDGIGVVELPGPRMPADRGLASLGLVMELGGSMFLGVMVMVGLLPLLAGAGTGTFLFLLLGAAGAARSGFHRAAGRALIYGSPGGMVRPIHIYIGVSVVQTVLTLLIINKNGGVPGQLNLLLLVLLLAWPLTLLVMLSRPPLRDLAREDALPHPEDMGFEGSAVIMLVLGLIGSLLALLGLYVFLKLPGGAIPPFSSLLLLVVLAVLLGRSVLHAIAGARGARVIAGDASDSIVRYLSFGVLSSAIVGGALFLLVIATGVAHPVTFLFLALTIHLLLCWPLILRRFSRERELHQYVASEHPRAPDAGLTALGWLILALGVHQLAGAAIGALAGQPDMSAGPALGGLGGESAAELADSVRSPWWAVCVAMTQVWAGLELVHMTDRYRLAASIYGAFASLVTLYISWPQLQAVGQLGDMAALAGIGGAFAGSFEVVGWLGMAISLVLPLGAAALANRKFLPAAHAHIRVSPTAEPRRRPPGGGSGTSIID